MAVSIPATAGLPPGPGLSAMAATLWFLARPTQHLERMHRAYGDLYTIENAIFGREVIVNHPRLIKEVFAGDPDIFHAGEVQAPLRKVAGDGSLLVLDGPVHRRHRKLLMPSFNGERMFEYTSVMRDVTLQTVQAWPEGKAFSIMPSMHQITLETILRCVFGAHEGEELALLRGAILKILGRMHSPAALLFLVPALQRDLSVLTPWAAFMRELAEFDALILRIIERVRAQPEQGRGSDILSLLLSARDEHGEPLSDRDLRDELLTLLIGGHDTTGTGLAWMFEEILRRPEVHARIVQELRGVAGDGLLEREHVQRLPYLDAVMKEVLRLRPVIPLVGRKLKQDITLGGHTIPEGVVVVPNVYIAQRHPDAYEQPEEFRAERFLEKKPQPHAWLPFGGGARRCIGMAFALLEMKVVIATVLANVGIRAASDKTPRVALKGALFAPRGGGRVVVERR